MKRKTIIYFLMIEAILCTIFAFLSSINSYSIAYILKLPFDPVANLLKTMSLSGFIGNLFATIIFVLFCSLPIVIYMILRKKEKHSKEDILLIILSIALFICMYILINPAYLTKMFNPLNATSFGLVAIEGTLYSIIVCYLILKILNYTNSEKTINIISCLKILLTILSIILVFCILGINLNWLITTIKKVAAGNSDNANGIMLTNVFLVIEYLIISLPGILEIWIIYNCDKFLNYLATDSLSDQSLEQSKYIIKISKLSIIIISVSYMIHNVSQLLFSTALLDMNYVVNIPIIPLIFVFAVLLSTKYLSESKIIKNDNDMII